MKVEGVRRRQRQRAPALERHASASPSGNLRPGTEAAEYKHVVLGLVFLKYVADAFEARRHWLQAATADSENTDYYVPNPAKRDEIVEARDEYSSENVFWVPAEARWGYLQDRAKQLDIGLLIDNVPAGAV